VFNSCQALIVSSDSLQCLKTEEIAGRMGLQCIRCASLTDARASIEEQSFQFVLCSDDLPDCNLRTAVRVLTGSTGGAFDYIACPPDPIETERIFRLALAQNSPPGRASRTAA
jgi:hypothetical protein